MHMTGMFDLQGTTLESSDRGPIRIQFSRNPFFGRKRQFDGTQASETPSAAAVYIPLKTAEAGGAANAATAAAVAASAEALAGSAAIAAATTEQPAPIGVRYRPFQIRIRASS